MYHCEACGKEMDRDEQYCEECAATLAMMGELPEKKPAPAPSAPTQKPVAKASSGDEKKGLGPAIAALVFAIIAFIVTGIIALVMNFIQPYLLEAFQPSPEISSIELTATEIEELTMQFSLLKLAFSAVHFGGILFMLIAFILFIVAICKYYSNKTEGKAKSPIVIAYRAFAFLVASVVIALNGASNISAFFDSILAMYIN